MKNIKKPIAGLISILILSHSFPIGLKADELSEAESQCQEYKPKYDEILEKWNEGKKLRDYEALFEQMQESHHDYVGCIFDYAESEILKTKKARFGGAFEANTPNSFALDWMAPDQACIEDTTEIEGIIRRTEPTTLLGPILKAHSDYDENLSELLSLYQKEGETNEALEGTKKFSQKSRNSQELDRQKTLEVESSLVAMDVMFHSLKELRLSFVIHIKLQCSLKFLEKYRIALEGLRKVVDKLPRKTKDASITK